MTPNQIRAAMILANVRLKDIANKLKVTNGAVSQVIHGTYKSKRIQKEIAKAIGKDVSDVWPEYAA